MVIGKNFTSTDLKLSRLCRLPVRLKLPDLITIMVTIDIMLVLVIIRMFDDDNRNDEDGLHVKVGKKSRPSLFVLEDELGPGE